MFAFKNVPIPVKICSNPDSYGGDDKAFGPWFQNYDVLVSGLTGFVWTEDRLDKYVQCQKYPYLCGS